MILSREEKQRVRARAGYDIRRGKLKRQPCEVCGATPAECHHIDHADPERVMWLCKAHHEQTHSQFGKPAPEWMSDVRAAVRRIESQRPPRPDTEDQAASDKTWPKS